MALLPQVKKRHTRDILWRAKPRAPHACTAHFCARPQRVEQARPQLVAYAGTMRFVLGFDGGGTKTDCVLMDAAGAVLARSQGGPSNPLRVGFGAAIGSMRDAARETMAAAKIPVDERPRGICAALGGVGPQESAEKMQALLAAEFPETKIQICTDLESALAAAGDGPAIVIDAGTGSFAIGRNAHGETARAGGYGSQIGDEGSAYDIGRRAILAAMHENDRTGEDSVLGRRLLRELGCRSWSDVKTRAQAASDEVFPRLFSVVASLAEMSHEEAQGILRAAAIDLAMQAENLGQRLRLRGQKLLIAKMGGMIGRSKFLETQLDDRLRRAFPDAEIGPLRMAPAEAAARMALKLIGAD